MDRLRGWGCAGALAAAMAAGSASSAGAAPLLLTLQGHEHQDVAATVLFRYVGLSESTGRVEVTLTNDTHGRDLRLTAFGFDLPDAVFGVQGFDSSLTRWSATGAPAGRGRPGPFDVAALTGLDFHGGSAKKGIATGASANFSFSLIGTGMLGLDERSFLGPTADGPGRAFAARFQQVAGPEGDVATIADPPAAAVSEPTTLLLSGLSLLALASLHRRRTVAPSAGAPTDNRAEGR